MMAKKVGPQMACPVCGKMIATAAKKHDGCTWVKETKPRKPSKDLDATLVRVTELLSQIAQAGGAVKVKKYLKDIEVAEKALEAVGGREAAKQALEIIEQYAKHKPVESAPTDGDSSESDLKV